MHFGTGSVAQTPSPAPSHAGPCSERSVRSAPVPGAAGTLLTGGVRYETLAQPRSSLSSWLAGPGVKLGGDRARGPAARLSY